MPTASKQTAREIDLAAAQWAARVDRGLSGDEERELEIWLAGDSRRVGAYGRMRGVALYTERAQALGPDFDPANFEPPAAIALPSRRRLLAGGGVLAAGIAGAALLGRELHPSGARYETRRGELNVAPLADGSVMTLNTASTAQVLFTKARRTVRLIEGEALFDVARDAMRPFVVEAGDALVRSIGASFTVLRLGNAPVQVLVREGVVELNSRARARGASPFRVGANTRAVVSEKSTDMETNEVPPAEIGRELAWREGRLVFSGETLLEAAAQFARYSDTRIVIDDPTIAAEPITGLFQANDAVGFAQTIAASFSLRTRISEGEVRLER